MNASKYFLLIFYFCSFWAITQVSAQHDPNNRINASDIEISPSKERKKSIQKIEIGESRSISKEARTHSTTQNQVKPSARNYARTGKPKMDKALSWHKEKSQKYEQSQYELEQKMIILDENIKNKKAEILKAKEYRNISKKEFDQKMDKLSEIEQAFNRLKERK